VPLVANGSVRLLVPRNSSEHVLARVVYTGPVRAPIEKGQQIGELKVWRGDNVVLEVPLQASEAVGRGSLSQRAFDAATELVINLFRAGVQKL
jgi:D-alanyl-D-alanine carboxypeptidase (penicillin-binding protein 5/6)